MSAMELKKTDAATLTEDIIRENTNFELVFLSILNLPIDTDITTNVFMDITLYQMSKTTISLFLLS